MRRWPSGCPCGSSWSWRQQTCIICGSPRRGPRCSSWLWRCKHSCISSRSRMWRWLTRVVCGCGRMWRWSSSVPASIIRGCISCSGISSSVPWRSIRSCGRMRRWLTRSIRCGCTSISRSTSSMTGWPSGCVSGCGWLTCVPVCCICGRSSPEFALCDKCDEIRDDKHAYFAEILFFFTFL